MMDDPTWEEIGLGSKIGFAIVLLTPVIALVIGLHFLGALYSPWFWGTFGGLAALYAVVQLLNHMFPGRRDK